jgi:hypothetical protein
MNQDGKVKALKKVIDMLIVPKVNELEPVSGFKIRSVKVGLTSYGARHNEPEFRIEVDLTKEPGLNHRACEGMSHLILNVAEYIDTDSEIKVHFSELGSDIEFHNLHATSRVFRRTNEYSIKMITGEHG